MSHVLCITSRPDRPVIDETLVERLRDIVKGGAPVELCKGVAYDIACEGRIGPAPLEQISGIAREAKIDANLVPTKDRRKKLLIADMDSTIIEQECIDELADYAGKRTEISEITERAMRGEIDFEAALKARVAMLKGLPVSALEATFRDRITLTPGAKTLVATMNRLDAVTALVSGGFTFFTSRVAAATGFQTAQANSLVIENDALTGEVAEPILGRSAKQAALERLCAENGLALSDTLAVGDGANDLSMLGRAGLGVAFHAKPAVAEAAHARINHGDLTALLYLQGIPQAEFVCYSAGR